MPAPQASLLKQLAKTNLKSKAIKIYVDWKQPSGQEESKQYGDAFKPSEKTAVPNPMNLFQASSTNKYHVDAATDVSKKFETYIDGICAAIAGAWGQWHSMAMFTTGFLNGPALVIPPGSLQGPPLFPLIFPQGPISTLQELKYTKAIAQAFGTAFQTWHMGFTCNLQYPSDACFPGPMAPPVPCIPLPLASGASPGESMMSPAMLKNAMVGNLGDPQALHHADLFDAISQAINTIFTQWKATSMINLQAFGPIPTFAPPFVPCGPVVMGTPLPTPGVLQ
jgi:hypothetical protein